jgi:hypothetical protein
MNFYYVIKYIYIYIYIEFEFDLEISCKKYSVRLYSNLYFKFQVFPYLTPFASSFSKYYLDNIYALMI